jgi:hypothetical protein
MHIDLPGVRLWVVDSLRAISRPMNSTIDDVEHRPIIVRGAGPRTRAESPNVAAIPSEFPKAAC